MSGLGSEYNEKRNFIRMFVNANVEIVDPQNSQRYMGQGKNLSGDGAMFTTDKEFTVNQRLNLEIKTEENSMTSLTAEFEVVRVKELSGGGFEIAGTMLDVK
ncbi:MAG: PilZ domain-containing protein [Kangiellaceae bacterium]|nr:PilZ domain-containing protein [Kangiellaceae bacterium]